MKKLVLLIAFAGCIVTANAQSIKLQSAISDLKNGRLDRAKTNIDEASVHENTKDDAKTWRYKASIYYELAITTKDKYKGLAENPLETAIESAVKSIQLDKEKEFFRDNFLTLRNIANKYYDDGVDYFGKNDFKNAYIAFNKTAEINRSANDIRGMADAYYNAAIAAENIKDTVNSIRIYKVLATLDYPKSRVYAILCQSYKNQSDTIKAVATIEKAVTNAEKKAEDAAKEGKNEAVDYTYYIIMADIYSWIGNKAKANDALNKALASNSKNPIILNAVGVMLEGSHDFEGAKTRYSESLAIQPEQYDANYNLGALYFNKAVDNIEAAGRVPMSDNTGLYDKLMAEAKANFISAIPYLETAIKIKPKDPRALSALKECYGRTDQVDKMQEIHKKMQELNLY